MTHLIADIGATNARFALVRQGNIDAVEVLACADYPTLDDAARRYLEKTAAKPETGVFAVATALDGSDRVAMTNHPWVFSIRALTQALGLKYLKVINDFEAIAHAVPFLGKDDYYQVGSGTPEKNMPIAIIGPGSGLGAAGIVFARDGAPIIVPTEGGHVTMPASTPREFALFEFLKFAKYSHISAERVISGKGLANLYLAISGVDNTPLPERTPAEIAATAMSKTCPACVEALDLFCHFLGVVAGNQALTLGAKGGAYIAGGIVPQLGVHFATSRFRESFLSKGRFRAYLENIPTRVITHPYPALAGLKSLA